MERSANGTDFSKVGAVAAKYNSNGSASYSWFDANPNTGNNYYRIKVLENSGENSYSRVVNVTLTLLGKITAYSNPVIGKSLRLQFNNLPKDKYAISILNNLGQQLFQKSVQHTGGSDIQTIQLPSSISKGIYTLQVRSSENVNTQQMMVK